MPLLVNRRALLSGRAAPSWVLPGFAGGVDMNFASGLYYGATLSMLSVVRTSVAYAPNIIGNWLLFAPGTPRITNLGLKVEEQRTNLVLQWTTNMVSPWINAGVSAISGNTTDVVDPLGTNTATKLNITPSGTQGYYQGSIPVVASTVYTYSFFVQLGTMPASDFLYAIYDETNATFIASNISPTIVPLSNGWFRVVNTFTSNTTQTSLRIYVARCNAVTGGTVYVWGVQVEAGGSATTIIPTTTTSATRNADNITLAVNPGLQYTLYAAWLPDAPTGYPNSQTAVNLNDGTLNNRLQVGRQSLGGNANTTVVGSTATIWNNTSGPSLAANVLTKSAISFASGAHAWAADAVLATDNTAGVPVGLKQLSFGIRSDVQLSVNAFLTRIAFQPTIALSGSQIVKVTT